jgi:hypothetical protein
MPKARPPANPTPGTNPNLELLERVGIVVSGKYWQKPTGEALGTSGRHLVRWKGGKWPVPDVLHDGRHLAVRLLELLDEHQKEVDAVRHAVIKALPQGGRPGT